MKIQSLDTEIAVPFTDIVALGGAEKAFPIIMRRLREQADTIAFSAKGRIIATRMPETVVKRTSSMILGGDLLLVAARWSVEVPESFRP
jgi:hypothetical protein